MVFTLRKGLVVFEIYGLMLKKCFLRKEKFCNTEMLNFIEDSLQNFLQKKDSKLNPSLKLSCCFKRGH
ncbi:hypothetical protein B9T33_10640 [Acinetobacter sp. ANC 5054]|nr:hypothetical protein B9T33_10640 [Acinetobacter sp. ANC 5054]